MTARAPRGVAWPMNTSPMTRQNLNSVVAATQPQSPSGAGCARSTSAVSQKPQIPNPQTQRPEDPKPKTENRSAAAKFNPSTDSRGRNNYKGRRPRTDHQQPKPKVQRPEACGARRWRRRGAWHCLALGCCGPHIEILDSRSQRPKARNPNGRRPKTPRAQNPKGQSQRPITINTVQSPAVRC